MVSDRQEGMSDFLTCLFMMGIVSGWKIPACVYCTERIK